MRLHREGDKGKLRRAENPREQALNALQELLRAARAGAAQRTRGMFDDIADTTGDAALKQQLVWGVVSLEELVELQSAVDKARRDDEKWQALWGKVGVFVGGLVKGALLLALFFTIPAVLGCSTPTPVRVREAHEIQGRATDALKANHDALMQYMTGNLLKTWNDTLNRFSEYELLLRSVAEAEQDQRQALREALDVTEDLESKARIQELLRRLKDSTVTLGFVQQMLQEGRAAREKFEERVRQIQVYDGAFQNNYAIAAGLHESLRQFLNREQVSPDDAAALVNDLQQKSTQLQWTKMQAPIKAE